MVVRCFFVRMTRSGRFGVMGMQQSGKAVSWTEYTQRPDRLASLPKFARMDCEILP